jgi:hypothetical protein
MNRFLVVLIVAATIFTGSEARADGRTSITTAGHCTEYATGVFVDRQKAQALVPDDFTVEDRGGKALVVMFSEACETSTDGGPAAASVVSGVFVGADPEHSPAACGAYDWFWADSVDGDWLAGMRELGWRMELVEGATFATSLGSLRTDEPNTLAPWTTTVAAVESPPVLSEALVSVHCHRGPRGVVRGTFDHNLLSAGAGTGPLTLGDGPIWRALGAQSQATAPGLVLRFTWTGITEIVE